MKGCSGNELDHSVDSRDSGENDNNELVVDGEITGMEVVGGGSGVEVEIDDDEDALEDDAVEVGAS